MVAALRDEGLEENTLIFFFSDNGGPTMPGTTINGATNTPLRGSKRQTWEGGIRVPFMIRWKEGFRKEDRLASDHPARCAPTALAAAGVEPRAEWKLDGVNLLPYLSGKRQDAPHDALYWRLFAHMAIRKGPWKLVKTMEGPPLVADTTSPDLSGAQLFNLANDIGEHTIWPRRIQEGQGADGRLAALEQGDGEATGGPGAGGRGRGG